MIFQILMMVKYNTLNHGVKEAGITMLITSHWPEVMTELADNVIWLEEGQIKEEGNPGR